jgi:NAD(P)-dependent dehydrogenase (short-subunit alcohol dehydrogenase family)
MLFGSTPNEPVAGKRVLITGGSSGIGLATAQRLGRGGARIALLARGEEALAQAADRVPGCDHVFAADAGDPEQIGAAVDAAADRLGGLDAVVAGAAALSYGPFLELEREDYERVISSTFLAGVHTAYASIPHLERTRGTLVLIASIAARIPVPWLTAYAASKHGLRGFARSLTCELDALDVPVRVALVNPGPVNTPIWRRAHTPDGRLPPEVTGAYRPEDAAAEIELAIQGRGPMERTVGGLMALWAAVDAVIPNTALKATAAVAGLGWRNREKRPPQEEDGLRQPLTEANVGGGLTSRPSLLTRLRTLGL